MKDELRALTEKLDLAKVAREYCRDNPDKRMLLDVECGTLYRIWEAARKGDGDEKLVP